MIFSQLFTPNHAKTDPKVRCLAVDKLSPNEPRSKQILHELAFNDGVAEVNLAALKKLNSFALWQKSAQTAKNQSVKKVAVAQVCQAILSEGTLSNAERKQFLVESGDTELCIKAAEQRSVLFDDSVFVLSIVKKINKSSITDMIFVNSQNIDLKRQLVVQQSELNVLQKWLTKTTDAEMLTFIRNRIATLEVDKNKPSQVIKETKLVLSKLLALADSTEHERANYEQVNSEKAALEAQFDALAVDFGVLKERDKVLFEEKKRVIDEKLSFHINKLYESYQKNESARQQSEQRLNFATKLAEIKDKVFLLFNDLEKATLDDLENAQHFIQLTSEQLKQKTELLGMAYTEPMLNELSQLSLKLTRVPEWQRHTQLMNETLKKLSEQTDIALKTSDDLSTIITTLQSDFDSVYDVASPLASMHLSKWKTLKKQLDTAKQLNIKNVKQTVIQIRKSLNVVISLIEQGKYKAALSKYAGIKDQWQKEGESVKASLKRKYTEVSHQIEHLEGWQSYLAEPRRPQLIEQANELINDTSLSMKKRAEQIKVLRKQWQSLSLTFDISEQDKQYNEAFDTALEQAFEPCRVYFAEQESMRQAAVVERQVLLHEMSKLLELSTPVNAEFVKVFEQHQKQWRNMPALPQADYIRLKAEFDRARSQLDNKVLPYFEANKAEKTDFIKRAERLLSESHSLNVTEQAKTLQQQWKAIDTAGARVDSRLWRSFREINDKIFEQAKQQSNERKAVLNDTVQALTNEVIDFERQCLELDESLFAEQYADLNSKIKELPKELSKGYGNSFLKRLADCDNRCKIHKQALSQAKRAGDVNVLIGVLSQLSQMHDAKSLFTAEDYESISQWSELSKPWQQAIQANESNTVRTGNNNQLEEQLVTLEILLSIDTPTESLALKQAIQLSLLNDSFNSQQQNKIDDAEKSLLSCFAQYPDERYLVRIENCINKIYLEKNA